MTSASRNRLLKAVATGGAVALLLVVGYGSHAQGAVGDPLLLGRSNWSSATTSLNWHQSTSPMPDTGLAVVGQQAGAVFATNEEYVTGDPTWIDGVRAFGNDRGGFFYGVNVGIVATSEWVGLEARGSEVGVDARGDDVGLEASGGVGVEASGDVAIRARGADVGLQAVGPLALSTKGAVSFSSAGLATVATGATSVLVDPGTDVTRSSLVLATAQTPGGQVLRVARNTSADTVRIHLVAPATQAVTIAYFVIR